MMNNFKNADLLEIVEELASYMGTIDSEEALSEAFDNMLEECAPTFDFDDSVMLSEAFNDWADGLCRDGHIHAEQYNKYCYVGKDS